MIILSGVEWDTIYWLVFLAILSIVANFGCSDLGVTGAPSSDQSDPF